MDVCFVLGYLSVFGRHRCVCCQLNTGSHLNRLDWAVAGPLSIVSMLACFKLGRADVFARNGEMGLCVGVLGNF